MSDPNVLQWDGAYSGTFLIEVDEVEIGRFNEVSGLQIDIDVEEYTEGGENGFVHKLPGRMKWPNLVLKRGITKDDVFMAWLQQAVGDGMATRNGQSKRYTAAVTLLGPDGVTRLRKWNVVDAIPVRWTGPTFASDATSAAVEELEIAHHGFRAS
jgi:phage tail-like protein